MNTIKRLISCILICVLVLSCSLISTSAFQEEVVTSSDAYTSEYCLEASFNNWQGTAMSYIDENTVAVSVELEEGSYQFNIADTDTEFGHVGTVKDTTVNTSSAGWLMSDSINAKCTLIATGGTYDFIFNTSTSRLQVIKDGVYPEDGDSEALIVNYSEGSLSADMGDTLTYTVMLQADKLFEDIQTIISFDESKLSLKKVTSSDSSISDNEAEAINNCPNISDVVYNSEHPGVVALNASNVDGYDFTAEKLYLTLDFQVIGKGETTLDFTAQEMTAVDGIMYFVYSEKNSEGAVFTEGLEISEKAPTPDKALSFASASLTLYNDISINFKVNETLFTQTGYTSPYAVFEINGETFIQKEYEIENGKYVFSFDNISPKNMNDSVTATLFANYAGVPYESKAVEYSVAKYCYNMLSKYSSDDNAKFRTLLVDLLNFGTASQIYAEYNTESLVNASLTADQALWATQEKPVYTNSLNLRYATVENPKASFKSAGLNLKNSVTLRFKIKADSIENLSLRIETDEYVWVVPSSQFEEVATGEYNIYFNGLNSMQMSEVVYVTVCEGVKPVSNTLSYSVETYAYSKSGSDANLDSVLETMIKYGNSAVAYAG